mmetsp:Transcript_50102/g.98680  ORF Transcript_50102/g.98680 Transcript_50102/m.98680 type:complete len:237 (+) Transcript_50102:6050-6760(+)
MDDSFVRLVVGVHEELHPPGGKRIRVDSITVVLGCDVALGGTAIDHGLVHSSVPVLHLEGLGTSSQSHQLVPQTNTEDRFSPCHHFLDVLDGRLAVRGVAGAVGEEQTVELLITERIVPRHDLQLDVVREVVDEVPDDVILHPAVNGHNGDLLRGLEVPRLVDEFRGCAVNAGFFPGHLWHEVLDIGVVQRDGVLLLDVVANQNLAQNRTVLANVLGQGTSVNACDSSDTLVFQPL